MLGLGTRIACSALFALLLLASLILHLTAGARAGGISQLEQRLAELPKPRGETWLEVERAKISELEGSAERLRARFAPEQAPESALSPLVVRQRIDEISFTLRESARVLKVGMPEEFDFPAGLPEREKGGDVLLAVQLAAEAAAYVLNTRDVEVIGLGAKSPLPGSAVAVIGARIPGAELQGLLRRLHESSLVPLGMELHRGGGISPRIELTLTFSNEFEGAGR